MNDMTELVGLENVGEFFAPSSTDMIDGLVGQYRSMRAKIEQIAAMVTGETAGAIGYFLDGNGRDSRHGMPSVERLFQVAGAIASLNSSFWSKAMQLTDVLNYMPQKRRDEWHKSITDQTCPEFDEQTVRDTIMGLLNMRSQFLAERVDGIFRGLSGEHVTNSPAAFSKRMIVGYVLNDSWSTSYDKCGLINDLRCVIAKFMGRDEPGYSASTGMIEALKGRWGEWVQVDGGALKIRLYKKGTAHIEVHPDMSWRLNMVLAHLYPKAIPPEFRQKPKRKAKEFDLMQRPLPFSVINVLASMRQVTRAIKLDDWQRPYRHETVENALQYDRCGGIDKHVLAEVCCVLESLGGVMASEGWWQFDYAPGDVISEVVASGCVPDQKAHQFYPTPDKIARIAVELAEISANHSCLEPEAGTGGLADYMPVARTHCIEVSKLRCEVLRAKGFVVAQADFIEWSGKTLERFDRIVMNPPFDQGRWKVHLEAAASLLKPGGRLVAILPESANGKDLLPGFDCSYPKKPFDNEFAGTGVSIVILVAERANAN